jgi:acyl-CoA synthetase (AMP-forming)/AMP-acid ligase II/acyl carrier protein
MNIAHWEADHVTRYGLASGIVDADRSWTNQVLYEKARKIASALIDAGLEPGDRVAVALPNSMELYVCCSAIWMAGGVVVVLGNGPDAELAPLLDHCDPRLIFRYVAPEEGQREERAQSVVMYQRGTDSSQSWAEIECSSRTKIRHPVSRESTDPAQLCYTSGTTGKPKAVIYTHGGTDAYMRSRAASFASDSDANVMLLALPPTAFGSRLISARLTGNVCYVLRQRFDPAGVLSAIERHRVTELPLVPSLAEQLAAWNPAEPMDVSSLASINLGGAHVALRLIESLRARFSALANVDREGQHNRNSSGVVPKISVVYGMTEAGGGFAATAHGGDGVVGPVGPSVDLRILGSDGDAVNVGEVGEITVRTPYAAVGYWRDDDATRKVFSNEFVRTGDLGKLTDTGELSVPGRKSDLIIQGGQNIHPEEIATVIRKLKGVADCAVVGVPDELMGEAATACVVPRAGASITEREIREHCRERLSERRLPAHVFMVDSLTTNTVGKVDLKSLREFAARTVMSSFDMDLAEELRAVSASDRETVICPIIETLLNNVLSHQQDSANGVILDHDTPFSELGLSSLGAVELARAIGQKVGRKLSPTLLFAYPTVRTLSAHISAEWRIDSPN